MDSSKTPMWLAKDRLTTLVRERTPSVVYATTTHHRLTEDSFLISRHMVLPTVIAAELLEEKLIEFSNVISDEINAFYGQESKIIEAFEIIMMLMNNNTTKYGVLFYICRQL